MYGVEVVHINEKLSYITQENLERNYLKIFLESYNFRVDKIIILRYKLCNIVALLYRTVVIIIVIVNIIDALYNIMRICI